MTKRFSGSLLLVFLAAPSGLVCQVNKSNLTGVVRDPSGAAVAAAPVLVVNTGTGATRRENTDETGLYRLLLLDFGTYRLEVQAPGFKKLIREGIQLQTGETTTVDLQLEVGQLSDSVTVTAESPMLRTETGALGTTMDRQVIGEIPIMGRNPYVAMTTVPGIQYGSDTNGLGPSDQSGPSDFAANGSSTRSEFLLDGIPNMRGRDVSFNPSPDAVEEMRVQTNAFDAEYGHSGAAFVNVSLRSGTNTVRGSLYWYFQHDKLSANDFFNNRLGRQKSRSTRNTYGLALGGPAYLPKLYNGRDRTHYFFDFEGTQNRSPGISRSIVPTALQRQGDFSQTLDREGRPYAIYDPLTTRPSGSGQIRSLFPGNVIPRSRFDPVAVNATQFYPLPNRATTAESLQNFETSGGSALQWASLIARGDHQISSAHNLFLRYGWNHRHAPKAPTFGECCRAASNRDPNFDDMYRGNITAAVGHTWIQSPHTVIDFRLGFSRSFDNQWNYGDGFDISRLGFAPSFVQSAAAKQFPYFAMSGGELNSFGPAKTAKVTMYNHYNPQANVHMALARHAVKFGFQRQTEQVNGSGAGFATGSFTFGRQFTQGPDPTRTALNSGHSFASFLLGTPTSGLADLTVARAVQTGYYSFYVQDDWKVSDRLTLNLGLRFEHEGGPTERFNNGNAGIELSVASPIEGPAIANYARAPIPERPAMAVKGGLRFLAVDGAPRNAVRPPTLDYAPRFGYAYRITQWMVWRGGWGAFYVPNYLENLRQDGFSLATRMTTSLDNNLTPFNFLADPFPNGLTKPPGSRGGLMTGVGQNLTAGAVGENKVPDYQHGMSQQFSMGFQFALPWRAALEASYVGNVSQRLTLSRNVNSYPDAFLPLKTRLNARVTNPFYGVITDSTSALSQPTIAVSQLLKPYPHFLGLTQAGLPFGRSHYDSLQLQVNKRMSHGLSFGVSYTASRYMTATGYLNTNDPKPSRNVSEDDRPQHLALRGVYELPFGPGKALLSSAHPVVRRIAEGWQLNWVISVQSGAPLSFSGAERLDRADNFVKSIDRWFDVKRFVPQEPFTLRVLSRVVGSLRAPGLNEWDLTAMKKISISERVRLQIQSEFYNAWNTPQFGSPNTSVTSESFGRITSTYAGPRAIQLSARISF